MKIKVTTEALNKLKTDGMIIPVFVDDIKQPAGSLQTVDKLLNGEITRLIKSAEITGKANDLTVIHTMGRIPARIIAVGGMGSRKDFELERLRNVSGQACRSLNKLNCRLLTIVIDSRVTGNIHVPDVAQAATEGAVLGLYTFKKYITKNNDGKAVTELTMSVAENSPVAAIRRACDRGRIIAEATNLARDMVNEPANYMTPDDLVRVARDISTKLKLDLTVMDRVQMKRAGMNALLGIAQGSAQPPRLMILTYTGNPKSKKHIAYVGKGVTFDSGGISIKPSENMKEMKGDMSGGAAALAAISAIAQLKLRVNVSVLVGATENLPGGKAIKPGDVVTAINGKTIEIVNTDAEGRVTLADVLGYAVKKGLSPIIDIATLTGACQVALGDVYSGLFTNNQQFADKVLEASRGAGELMWQLPVRDDYRELNKSDVADIKNSGGRYGGATTAAMFLMEFVDDVPWVHMDIAGTFMSDKEKGYLIKGATGVSVRTLVKLAENMAK